jgi:hypothetical protein
MPRKSGDRRSNQPQRESPRPERRVASRRIIKRDEDTTQLLERGEGPTAEEIIDPGVDSPSEITNDGGAGADASDRFGGPLSRPGEQPNPRSGGTGGDGGYSTLGGGVYPDEGREEDAPNYGDWQRHSSGTDSGARGQEGLSYPGESTWGEEQYRMQRQEEQGSPRPERRVRGRRSDEALARELQEILTNDPELDSTEIEVQVEDGAVTMIGVVDSPDAKLLAEELVESVTGVREVHNQLRVER